LDCYEEGFIRRYLLKLSCTNGSWKLEKICFEMMSLLDITKSIGALDPEEV